MRHSSFARPALVLLAGILVSVCLFRPHDGLAGTAVQPAPRAATVSVPAALSALRAAAAKGNAHAQFNLGAAYANGQGVKQDYTQAALWFNKAAEQGDAAAQSVLGVAYANGQGVPRDNAKAAYWYRKAAEQGNREFLRKSGHCGLRTLGFELDWRMVAQC